MDQLLLPLRMLGWLQLYELRENLYVPDTMADLYAQLFELSVDDAFTREHNYPPECLYDLEVFIDDSDFHPLHLLDERTQDFNHCDSFQGHHTSRLSGLWGEERLIGPWGVDSLL
jgi:hypothetical protein